jgi:hypothetical protein
LLISASLPEHAGLSLNAGDNGQSGLDSDQPDAYIFLQKRW